MPSSRTAVVLTVAPVRRLSVAVQAAAIVWTLLLLLLAAASWPARDELAAGHVGPAGRAVGILSLCWSVVIAASYLLTCVWLLRARVTAHAVSPAYDHARGLSWTWFGWLLPLLNLWFPYQVVRDVAGALRALERGTVRAWWACWLAGLYASALASERVNREVPDLAGAATRYLVAAVLTVAACHLWLQIVRRVTAAAAAVEPGTRVHL